ncbi:MAG: marine proteobacterial sortase target protein [Gammaproteobacteria bacterium]|nr:marine proteobacterial sortase target protein [Gammaproteobacteria bacterium]
MPDSASGWERCSLVRLASALCLLVLLGAPVAAEPESPFPGAQLRLFGIDGQGLRDAPRLHTDVDIVVTGLLVRVRVQQRFRNPADSWVEGVYRFPLPDDAAVDHLTMRYAGRLVEGEIQPRQQARREYEQARTEGRGASLVEQQRANLFSTAVANIPPGETVDITIEYQHVAQWQDDTFSLRFPMVVAPRYVPGRPLPADVERSATSAGWIRATDQVPDAAQISPPVVAGAGRSLNPVSLAVELHAGLELATLDSPYHPVDIETPAFGHYRVTLQDTEAVADRDFVLRWQPRLDGVPGAALFTETWRDRHYNLLMVMPAQQDDLAAQGRLVRELVLVVDTSGSMHGDSLAQAKSALQTALSTLRPSDHFNIIQFNNSVASLFGDAEPASEQALAEARRYIRQLRADGGTEMEPALLRALRAPTEQGRLRQVVFVTDGAVGNEQALFETISRHLGDSRLFTVGIGSAPNALFMNQAARFGRGTATFIGRVGEVGEKMSTLLRQLGSPQMADLAVTWLGADGQPLATDNVLQMPARLPDLYAGEPLVVAVQSREMPAEAKVSGRLGGRDWQSRLALGEGLRDAGIHVLWARRRIDDLQAALVQGEQVDSVREAATDVALEHHLVSRYTSLVAVDRTPSRPDAEPLRRSDMPVNLPAGWSADTVFGRLPGTATPALAWLLYGIASLLLVPLLSPALRRH